MFRRGKYSRPRRRLVRIPKSWIIGFLVVVGCAAGWSLHASADSVSRPDSELRTAAPREEPDEGATAGVAAALPPAMPPALPVVVPPALPALPGSLPATTPLGNPIERSGATTPDSTMWIDGGSLGGGATTPDSTMQIGAAPGTSPDVAGTYTPESSPVPAPPAAADVERAPSGSSVPSVTPVSTSAPGSAAVENDTAENDTDGDEADEDEAPGSDPTAPSLPRQPSSPAAPSAPTSATDPWPSIPAGETPGRTDTPDPTTPAAPETGIPPFIGEQIFTPLPGAPSRAVSFAEWETYRSDVSGKNIMLTTDDSNLSVNRDGKINGNTGDTDASGLNITDATDSFIRGSESADEAPYQTAAAALVDLASDAPGGGLGSDPDDDADDEASDEEESDEAPEAPAVPLPLPGTVPTPVSTPVSGQAPPATGPSGSTKPSGSTSSTAAAPSPAGAGPPTPTATETPAAPGDVAAPGTAPPGVAVAAATSSDDDDGGGGDESGGEEWDFPYAEWVQSVNRGTGSAVHTDEGTTLAAGADAFVVGADGYDDDDNRAYGENIVMTRDDGNVVLGGTGDVNSQIGDSEQGAVIMDVTRTFIQGGGAY